ncbi:SDR family NAD(P)-dependent oxidoreductase, partial [Streptomyces beijiangensis]
YWRGEAKAGRTVAARVINTTSGAGLLGSVGQGNYAAAKAGIVGLTLVAAAEMGRYGVQVNAIAPAARTRMTEETFGALEGLPEDVSPLVVWLGSEGCQGVSGRVFEAEAGRIT